MKANTLSALIGLYPRLRSIILRLLSLLAAEVGLAFEQFRNRVHALAGVKRRGQDGAVPRNETRVLPRADRFAIETTIRYRKVGQNSWYEGKTENISGSGVLFWTQKRVALKTQVEMMFPLPIKGSGASGANVKCFGQIVRKVPRVGAKGEAGLAATIEEYLLVHAAQGMSHAA
jgi:hypothetical protein